MKKIILTILFLLLSTPCFSAELLVQAKDSPFDNGAKKGDIIIVRPDGWAWGREECLPNYIVVKLPGVKEEDAKKYEQALTKEEIKTVNGNSVTSQVLVKKRKYNIDKLEVEKAITDKASTLSVASKDVSTFKITEKTISAEINP